MIVLGLTGSIGMGKSTATAVLRRLGVPLYDADAEIHKMLGPGGAAVAAVETAFPGVRGDGGIVVSAPLRVQRERVMRRPGMSAERFTAILASQLRDRDKRRRADF